MKPIILGFKALIIISVIFGTSQALSDSKSNALVLQVEALGFRIQNIKNMGL